MIWTDFNSFSSWLLFCSIYSCYERTAIFCIAFWYIIFN